MQLVPAKVKHILITGGTGFLGSFLVKAFLKTGYKVSLLKRKSSSLFRIKPLKSQIDCFDIENIDLTNFLSQKKIDAVIHAATCYGDKGETPTEILQANLLFPLSLLQSAIHAKSFVFLNIGTSLPPDISNYALSKKQFAEWGHRLCEKQFLQFINIRLEHLFGFGDFSNKFIPSALLDLARNTKNIDVTLGKQYRDFIYVEDAAEGILTILTNYERIEKCISIGTGQAISVKHFLLTAKHLAGASTELRFGKIPYRRNEATYLSSNINKMKSFGWHPSHSLEEGLKKTLDQIRINHPSLE